MAGCDPGQAAKLDKNVYAPRISGKSDRALRRHNLPCYRFPMKICSGCKLDLPDDSFWKDKGRLRSRCKGCDKLRRQKILEREPDYFAAKTARSVSKRRAWLKEFKESKPCADCGTSYPHYVMDLDHRWNEEKEFNVGCAVSLTKMKAEVDKCDLVCANCHRERTNSTLWEPMRKGPGEYAQRAPRAIGRPKKHT